METELNRMQQELPRTPPAERPGESPPPHGPGPTPVPERLPGEAPDPGRSPQEAPQPIHASLADDAGDDLSIRLPIGTSLSEIERAFIVATLEHFGGDKRRAASVLGCSVKTLYNKLHLYRRQLGHVAAVS